MVDPFLRLQKKPDLSPILFLQKDVCPVHCVCLPLTQESDTRFVVIVVSSGKAGISWVDVKAFSFIWKMVSYFILSYLCRFCFVLM